jgi:hypothetical protein
LKHLLSQDPQGKHLDLGQPTNRLEGQWSTADSGPSAFDLKLRPARFYSSDFPPEPIPGPPNFQEINNNLNTIRTQIAPQTFTSP